MSFFKTRKQLVFVLLGSYLSGKKVRNLILVHPEAKVH